MGGTAMITTQAELRAQFWQDHPAHERQARLRGTLTKGQNAQVTDTRVAWVDYVDHMARDGSITEALAQRATL